MPDRAEYQPLTQHVDDDDDDASEGLPAPVTAPPGKKRGMRRAQRPGNIDLGKLDNAFKR